MAENTLRQEALQTTFSVFLDIFYASNLAVWDEKEVFQQPQAIALKAPVNEFYKKGCQEKSSASTGGREDCGLEIQPTAVSVSPRFVREVFSLACLPFPWGFIFR